MFLKSFELALRPFLSRHEPAIQNNEAVHMQVKEGFQHRDYVCTIPAKRHRARNTIFGLTLTVALLMACCLMGCSGASGPGAGNKWTSYPALTSSTRSYPWLVVKCRAADIPAIPAGLDTDIQQFFGISGAGYGNMVDYFHDVSYNRASVVSDTFVGWVQAPFNKAD